MFVKLEQHVMSGSDPKGPIAAVSHQQYVRVWIVASMRDSHEALRVPKNREYREPSQKAQDEQAGTYREALEEERTPRVINVDVATDFGSASSPVELPRIESKTRHRHGQPVSEQNL